MPTPEPTTREDEAADVLHYRPGLSGPLLLVSLGIIINCCWLFILVVRLFGWLNTEEMAQIVPGHPSYHPLLKPFMVAELLTAVFFFFFTVRLAGAFFWKQKETRRLMIIYLLAALVFTLLEYVFILLIPWLRERLDKTGLAVVIYQALACVIWIPYFLFSRRVKGTFVH
jgi:Na+-driven multidrug efflux pump